LDPKKRELALRLYQERQHSIVEICQIMGISKSTLYNYLAEQGVGARSAA
jgi:transposase-like protein